MRHNIRHRIHRNTIRAKSPLYIQLVLAARDIKKSKDEEVLIDNFCQRPGRMNMDH